MKLHRLKYFPRIVTDLHCWRGVSSLQVKSSQFEFNNHQSAFKSKKTTDILRALFFLQLSSMDFMVNNANKLIYVGRRLLSRKLFDYFLKRCIYSQFAAGENIAEIHKCVRTLQACGIRAMLAVPVEEDLADNSDGNKSDMYERNLQLFMDCFNLESTLQPDNPLIQIRMSAIVPPSLLARIGELCPSPVDSPEILQQFADAMCNKRKVSLEGLTQTEELELNKVIKRLIKIGETARKTGTRTLIDAEYTYFNPATKLFVLSSMLAYNTDNAWIGFTYQNYLKKCFKFLQQDVEFIQSQNRYFGAKLVRGAYMFRERELAKLNNYEDPIHEQFDHTTAMYHQSMDYMLNHIANGNKCAIMIASHNEKTIQYFMDRVNELQIDLGGGQVSLGQLYGMCDHVSYSLGDAGYPIYKSIPYGEIDQTIPYLIRRAQENRSVLPGARKEKDLLKKDLLYRFGLNRKIRDQKNKVIQE